MAPREDEERRTEMVLIRVTPEEKRVLTETAKRHGMGLSSWLRYLGLVSSRPTERTRIDVSLAPKRRRPN